MVCAALVLAALCAAAFPGPQEARGGSGGDDGSFPPPSFDPGEYGRVSEEVMILMRPARPGDIIIWIERFGDDVDRRKYYLYRGLDRGGILVDEVYTTVDFRRNIDRVAARRELVLSVAANGKAYFETTDFYRKPFKALLTAAVSDGTLTVQGVQELEIPVFDFSE